MHCALKQKVVSSGKRISDITDHLKQWEVQFVLIKEFKHTTHCTCSLGRV